MAIAKETLRVTDWVMPMVIMIDWGTLMARLMVTVIG